MKCLVERKVPITPVTPVLRDDRESVEMGLRTLLYRPPVSEYSNHYNERQRLLCLGVYPYLCQN